MERITVLGIKAATIEVVPDGARGTDGTGSDKRTPCNHSQRESDTCE